MAKDLVITVAQTQYRRKPVDTIGRGIVTGLTSLLLPLPAVRVFSGFSGSDQTYWCFCY